MAPDRAVLVGVVLDDSDHDDLDELSLLSTTAGARVVERLVQRRPSIHVAHYVGKGKLDEIRDAVREHEATVVIFDDDLSPVQIRNLEKATEVRVIDRSTLILDIFAAHARTHEAKLQVELAQLQYIMPRLTRMWTHLGRAGGGIGTRGPGETQLEVDRRRIRTRVSRLKGKIADVEKERVTQGRGRDRIFKIALAGYTNAGKSTLFNALTRADVLVENKLFATLDTTTRQVYLEGRRQALLSDTVGFIRKLPHHLVASFRSTLREVIGADLILHVVDGSSDHLGDHIAAVDSVLAEIGADAVPRRLVLNKIDRLDDDRMSARRAHFGDAHFVSALSKDSVNALRAKLAAEQAAWTSARTSVPR